MICEEESSLNTNTKMKSMWTLEVIFLLSFVALETTSASQFTCRKRKLTVTVDDYMELYFDGIEIHETSLPNAKKHNKPDVVDLPCTTKLIAIHGRNGPAEAGILASTEDGYLLTNSSWKCSSVERLGWKEIYFDDSGWVSAMEYGHNGNTDMSIVPSISSSAVWIWLRQDISRHVAMDSNVYCRRRLEINKCESSPCQHGGSCFNSMNNYVCVCPPEWTGVRCRIRIDACDSYPCLNGGRCKTSGGNSFTCACPIDAIGVKCESLINYCDSSPCANGGSCKSTVNGYNCQCQPGHTGHNCEYVIDYCKSAPCLNGGSCKSTKNGYVCQCSPGYTDDRCQNAIATESDSTSWKIFLGISILTNIALLYALCVFCSRKKKAKDEVKDEGGNNEIHQNDRVEDSNVRHRIVQN